VGAAENLDQTLLLLAARIKALEASSGAPQTETVPIGGQFLFDPGEFNGWGIIGPVDNTNNQKLANVGNANISRTAGGLCFSFDVRLKRFFAWHYNSNPSVHAWGWRIDRQTKTAGSNSVSGEILFSQVTENGGTGPNDYGNTVPQKTDVSFTSQPVIPAGDVTVLGVEAPTAVGTNYYARVMAGYLEFDRA